MDKQQINRSLQKETKAGDHQEILKENYHVKNKIETTNRSPKINSKSAWKTIRAIFYIKTTTPKERIKIFLEWGGGIIFRTTPSCKHFFRYFFNHVLTQKGDSLFADGQSLFNFNILRWQPTNWKKRNRNRNPPITARELYLLTPLNSSFSFSETYSVRIGGSEKRNRCFNFKCLTVFGRKF